VCEDKRKGDTRCENNMYRLFVLKKKIVNDEKFIKKFKNGTLILR